MEKDSVGNPLPELVCLPEKATWKQIDFALALTSFRLAISVATQKGATVIYDASSKSATITYHDGFKCGVFHV